MSVPPPQPDPVAVGSPELPAVGGTMRFVGPSSVVDDLNEILRDWARLPSRMVSDVVRTGTLAPASGKLEASVGSVPASSSV